MFNEFKERKLEKRQDDKGPSPLSPDKIRPSSGTEDGKSRSLLAKMKESGTVLKGSEVMAAVRLQAERIMGRADSGNDIDKINGLISKARGMLDSLFKQDIRNNLPHMIGNKGVPVTSSLDTISRYHELSKGNEENIESWQKIHDEVASKTPEDQRTNSQKKIDGIKEIYGEVIDRSSSQRDKSFSQRITKNGYTELVSNEANSHGPSGEVVNKASKDQVAPREDNDPSWKDAGFDSGSSLEWKDDTDAATLKDEASDAGTLYGDVSDSDHSQKSSNLNHPHKLLEKPSFEKTSSAFSGQLDRPFRIGSQLSSHIHEVVIRSVEFSRNRQFMRYYSLTFGVRHVVKKLEGLPEEGFGGEKREDIIDAFKKAAKDALKAEIAASLWENLSKSKHVNNAQIADNLRMWMKEVEKRAIADKR